MRTRFLLLYLYSGPHRLVVYTPDTFIYNCAPFQVFSHLFHHCFLVFAPAFLMSFLLSVYLLYLPARVLIITPSLASYRLGGFWLIWIPLFYARSDFYIPLLLEHRRFLFKLGVATMGSFIHSISTYVIARSWIRARTSPYFPPSINPLQPPSASSSLAHARTSHAPYLILCMRICQARGQGAIQNAIKVVRCYSLGYRTKKSPSPLIHPSSIKRYESLQRRSHSQDLLFSLI